jgi:hypothetical protein
MPELAGQLRAGTPLTERDCFQRAIAATRGLRDLAMADPGRVNVRMRFGEAIEQAKHLRDSLRGLGLLRMDQRWLLLARSAEGIEDSIKRAASNQRADWRGLAPICERLEHTIRQAMDRAGRPPILIPSAWERH